MSFDLIFTGAQALPSEIVELADATTRFSFFQSYILVVQPRWGILVVYCETLSVVFRYEDSSIVNAALTGCTAYGFLRLSVLRSTTLTSYYVNLNSGFNVSATTTLRPPQDHRFATNLVAYPNGGVCVVVKQKNDNLFSVVRIGSSRSRHDQWVFHPQLRDFSVEPLLRLIDNQSTLLCVADRRMIMAWSRNPTVILPLDVNPKAAFSLAPDHLSFFGNEIVRTYSLDDNDLTKRHTLVFDNDQLRHYISHRSSLYVVNMEDSTLARFEAVTAEVSNADTLVMHCMRLLRKIGFFTSFDESSASESLLHNQVGPQEVPCLFDDSENDGNLLTTSIPSSARGESLLTHLDENDDDDGNDAPAVMVPFSCSVNMTYSEKSVAPSDMVDSWLNDGVYSSLFSDFGTGLSEWITKINAN